MKSLRVFALLVVLGVVWGQQTAAPGSVEGRVVSATTGEPLRKATLTLKASGSGARGSIVATSDNDGNFRMTSVAPGRYYLNGERTAYVAGQHPDWIDVTSGQATRVSSLKLIPQSVITGRVSDEDGDAGYRMLDFGYSTKMAVGSISTPRSLIQYPLSGIFF